MQYIYDYLLFLSAGAHWATYLCLWYKKTDAYKTDMNTDCNEHNCYLKK